MTRGGLLVVLPTSVVQYRLMNSHGLHRRPAIVTDDPGTIDATVLAATGRLNYLIGRIVDVDGGQPFA